MVQTYADKLAGLELELFVQVVNSLVFGSQHVSQESTPPARLPSAAASRSEREVTSGSIAGRALLPLLVLRKRLHLPQILAPLAVFFWLRTLTRTGPQKRSIVQSAR